MYQRNERNKLVFKPAMLKQGGEGLYIVCENDEELKAREPSYEVESI